MNYYWRNIKLFFILVFLYASVSNMYADVRKSQKAYRVEMAKAGNYYYKSDMANTLKSLRKVYVQALEEEDHATMLEAVDLLCQVQESMEFISALEKNAQRLKAFSSNIHDVEDVAYYEKVWPISIWHSAKYTRRTWQALRLCLTVLPMCFITVSFPKTSSS